MLKIFLASMLSMFIFFFVTYSDYKERTACENKHGTCVKESLIGYVSIYPRITSCKDLRNVC